jgi:hypothetical protein
MTKEPRTQLPSLPYCLKKDQHHLALSTLRPCSEASEIPLQSLLLLRSSMPPPCPQTVGLNLIQWFPVSNQPHRTPGQARSSMIPPSTGNWMAAKNSSRMYSVSTQIPRAILLCPRSARKRHMQSLGQRIGWHLWAHFFGARVSGCDKQHKLVAHSSLYQNNQVPHMYLPFTDGIPAYEAEMHSNPFR